MAVNTHALVRYRALDDCLKDTYRQWTLEDLIIAVSDALYAYDGSVSSVSKRTVQADIQMLRSDELGYNAPIVVTDKKYYSYGEESYTITDLPLSGQHLEMVTEALAVLRQCQGFAYFSPLEDSVLRIDDYLSAKASRRPFTIVPKTGRSSPSLEHFRTVYTVISNKKAMKVTYRAESTGEELRRTFHPYQIKEHDELWYVMGRWGDAEGIMALALDTISAIGPSTEVLKIDESYDPIHYFDHLVGVHRPTDAEPVDILVRISAPPGSPLLLRPIHQNQVIKNSTESHTAISLRLYHNEELEQRLISYGEHLSVLAPESVREAIEERKKRMIGQ